jgi:hypothetical protein
MALEKIPLKAVAHNIVFFWGRGLIDVFQYQVYIASDIRVIDGRSIWKSLQVVAA